MSMFVRFGMVVLFVTSFGLSVGMHSPIVEAAEVSGDQSTQEIRSIVEQFIGEKTKKEGVGATVVILSEEQEGIFGFGTTQLKRGQLPDGDTVYEIGSISKVFTGIALADAIEKGEVELKQAIETIIPESASISAIQDGTVITLEHLTTHTSGLPPLPSNLLSSRSREQKRKGGDPYRHYSVENLYESFSTADLATEPGTRSEYSNYGVGILGHALARNAQTSYEDLVISRICTPLGMGDTGIALSDDQIARFAQGHKSGKTIAKRKINRKVSSWELPEAIAGAGAIRSTGNDMKLFLAANMGRLSSELDSAIKTSHQELFSIGKGAGVGMGWHRVPREDIGKVLVWHNGQTGGYNSFIGFTDDMKHGVVILSNSTVNHTGIGMDILTALSKRSAKEN